MANRRFMRPCGPSYPDMGGQDWDLGAMDPRLDEYYSNVNHYNSGPGYYLPPEQQAYSKRATGLPFRMFISGIHPQTTEEGISNIFSMYGIPIRVFKTRNKNNEPIGFVDFATQMEADNAIIGLDGKPPLHWRVTYSLDHNRRDPEYFEQYADAGAGFYEELEQHTPMHPLPGMAPPVVGHLPRTVPFPVRVSNLGAQSLPNVRGMPSGASSHPPCIICGIPAESACSKCKAPYCSINCQSFDWNKHKNECVSPPALEPVKPRFSGASQVVRSSTVSITELQPSRPASSNKLESASGVTKSQVKNEDSVAPTKPHAFGIKVNGITPLSPADAAPQPSNAHSQLTGQHRSQPVSQKSPKKNGWLNNASNINTPPMGNLGPLRAGSFPMKNASPKSAVTNGPLARISPLNRPRPDIYAKLFTVNKLSPLRNKPSQVIVRAATAPDNFFVQYLNFKEMLDKLTNELQLAAQNAPPLMEPVLENSPCLAMCPLNGKWLRAQILKVWDDAVGVSFVDYGHRKKLSKTPEYVRMMEHEFALKPFLAINVKLAEVLPLEGSDWSKEVKTFFNTLVEDKTLTMEFVQSEGDVMVVRLANSNGRDLGSYLVNENKVKRISKQQEITDELDRIHLSTNEDSVVAPPPQVIYKTPQETAASKLMALKMTSTTSSQNAQTVVARTNVSAPVGQSNPRVQRPSPPVVQSTTSTQSAASESATSTAPVLPRASALAELLRKASAPRFVASSILDFLAPNDIAIFSPTLAFNAGFAAGTLIRSEIDLVYEEFHTVVEGEPPVPNFKPSVGTKVAALSVAHGQYFRGCVTKSSGSSFAIVFIDYGNSEDGVTTVKPSPSSFKVPELAVKFTPMSKEAERFAAQNVAIDTAFNLEVVSVEKGQFSVVKIADFPDLQFKLEPWTTLIQPEDPPQLTIPKALLETGYTGDVMITVAEDLDQIFVQPIKEENLVAMNDLQEAMNKYLNSSTPLKVIPTVGTFVASLFPEDGGFYRARVDSVRGDYVKVHFIDFGNSCEVTLAELRSLPQELFKFPNITYQVSLACVAKPASNVLPASVKALLSSLVNQLGTMLVIDSSDGLIDCTLTVDGKVVNQEVSELLEASSKPAVAAMPKLVQSVPEEEPKPIVQQQVDNTLGVFRYEDGSMLDLPEGRIFQAMIFSVDSPQMIMMCEGTDSVLAQLGQLQDEMTQYATSVALGHTPTEGEICIVRSLEDGDWYRGACIQVNSGGSTNSFQFLLVDFGSVISCFADDVRRIPKRFVDGHPFVAQHAILKGCEHMEVVSENLVKRSKDLLPINAPVEVKVESRADLAFVVDIPSVSSVLKSEGLL